MKKHTPFLIALSILVLAIAGWKFSYFDFMTLDHSEEKVWVYIEVEVELASDTSNYFYHGQIKKSIINTMDANPNAKGFFKLYNIRYWDKDDLLAIYEDNYRLGYKIFKIENIRYLQAYKNDPVLSFDETDLHHSSKALRARQDTLVN